jgi:hypothetical protein
LARRSETNIVSIAGKREQSKPKNAEYRDFKIFHNKKNDAPKLMIFGNFEIRKRFKI